MARAQTTLSSAMTVNDTSVVVGSATNILAGTLLRIDQEILKVQQAYPGTGTTVQVLRGRDGTATAAHRAGAFVTSFLASDQTSPLPPQTSVMLQTQKANVLTSYTASGAITLPAPGSDATAVLNGTAALAMTIASPTTDMDGSVLYIVNNGKAAHTVTYAAGLGNNTTPANADVITWFATGAQGIILIAVGGFWVTGSGVAGAATLAGVGIG